MQDFLVRIGDDFIAWLEFDHPGSHALDDTGEIPSGSTGNQVSIRLSPKPACNAISAGLMAAAFIRTITAFCDSFGSGKSPYSRTSDPPKRL